MEDGHDHRYQGQRDHDEHEQEVGARGGRLACLRRGRGEPAIPEHDGDRDQAQDRDHPTESGSDEDQEPDRGDRVGRHPLARKGEAEEQPDRRHQDPEGSAPLPRSRPEPGEQDVRRHEEEPHVHVVHGDPRLDEEHPVGQREDGDENADRAPPEEDPREEEDEPGGQRARDDTGQAPAELVIADVDAGHRTRCVEGEDRLPVGGRIGRGDIGRPGGRRERQARVGIDRVAVRLDDVDRRARAVRGRAEDVDHDRRRIERHALDLAGHGDRRLHRGRPHVGALRELDDRDGLAGRDEQAGRVEVGRCRKARRAAGDRDLLGHLPI